MAVEYSGDITPWSAQSSVAGGAGTHTRLSGSRTAVISLVDSLAQHSMPALVLIFAAACGLALFHLASAASFPAMARTIIWLAMVLAPGWVTGVRLRRFRSGVMLTGRPLTWRTGHVAGLALTSTALGCGALMLAAGVGDGNKAVTLCLLSALLTVSGLGHIAYARAALAASVPGLVLTGIGALAFGAGLASLAIMTVIVAAGGLWGYARYRALVAQTLEHHPRQHETAIKARQKKKSRAYNPFKKSPAETGREPRRPWLYSPREL